MLANEFNSSKQYVDNLSVNTKRGLRQKVRRGEMPGVAPIGYYNDLKTKTAKVDRKIAPIIVQAFELYAKGDQRLDQIADFLYAKGIRTKPCKVRGNTMGIFVILAKSMRANIKVLCQNGFLTKCKKSYENEVSNKEKPTIQNHYAVLSIAHAV